jgi:hypothetical protein
VDIDRSLKNDLSDSLKAFIGDQKLTFTDKQFIRALFILHRGTGDFKAVRKKDRIVKFLMNNILNGKFEIKKGNTIASFFQALAANFDTIFPGTLSHPQNELFNEQTPIIGGSTDVMQIGTFVTVNEMYGKLVRVCSTKLIPFLKMHCFGVVNKELQCVQESSCNLSSGKAACLRRVPLYKLRSAPGDHCGSGSGQIKLHSRRQSRSLASPRESHPAGGVHTRPHH